MKTINAKGGVCPDPVAKTKAEIDRGEAELDVLLDDPVSASKVMRFLESNGFGVQLKDDEGAIIISARKSERSSGPAISQKQPDAPVMPSVYEAPSAAKTQPAAPASPAPAAEPSETSEKLSVLITNLALGSDRELGETLMKGFLSALSRMQRPPIAVALINEGVKLALYDSSSCDHLKNLETKGVSILVCGTSANYFSIMDQLGAGSISNTFEITESLDKACKIMTL